MVAVVGDGGYFLILSSLQMGFTGLALCCGFRSPVTQQEGKCSTVHLLLLFLLLLWLSDSAPRVLISSPSVYTADVH